MTREEAINEIKSWDFLNEKESEAVRTLIPELCESEDERIRKSIVATIEQCPDDFLNPKNRDRMLAWLEKQKEQKPAEWEDYKDKVNIPYCSSEPEWSEEDEKMLARIIERGQSQIQMFETGLLPEHIAWLKSLRPSWKPSEEQMRQLCDAAYLKAKISDDIYVFPELRSLYYDLQKLTEK